MTLYEEGDVSTSPVNDGLNRRLSSELAEMREQGVLKRLQHICGMQGPVVDLEGFGETINLCSNNYLGMCDVPEVVAAVKEGADRYGAGTSSVRFICGTFDVHRDLEDRIADFLETEAAVTFTSCWNANEGLFAPLLDDRDALISDELNHASIIDGIRLCKAQRHIYRHMDMDSLEDALKGARDARHRFVITAKSRRCRRFGSCATATMRSWRSTTRTPPACWGTPGGARPSTSACTAKSTSSPRRSERHSEAWRAASSPAAGRLSST